jgi:CubicO group peptidase (beta-lactamase class C family)
MPHTFALTRLALVVTVLGCATASEGAQGPLNDTLTPMLTRYQLPALTAAVVKGGKVITAGAVGTRRAGSQIPVTVNDRFHLNRST